MAKNGKTKAQATKKINDPVILMRGVVVSHYDDCDELLATSATPAQVLDDAQKEQLGVFINRQTQYNAPYLKVMVVSPEAVRATIERGMRLLESDRKASERRMEAERKRQEEAERKRKLKRLERLERLAREAQGE